MTIKIRDSKKMKNYFFELLNNGKLYAKNSEIIYQDNKDEFLIEILKVERFDLINIYINLKKKKYIQLVLELSIFSLKKKYPIIENLIKNTEVNQNDKD